MTVSMSRAKRKHRQTAKTYRALPTANIAIILLKQILTQQKTNYNRCFPLLKRLI